MNKKIGKIQISNAFLSNDIERVSEVLKALSFVPYRAEFMYHFNGLELIGYSPLFEEIKEGNLPNEYGVKINTRLDEETEKYVIDGVEVKKMNSTSEKFLLEDANWLSRFDPKRLEQKEK